MKIVSLDGGGIKGIMTARILERLEAQVPGWLAKVDLFAGTSTGGILALALASGMTPAQCVELYRDNGAAIFASRGVGDTLTGGADEYFRSNYGQEGIRATLERVFGDRRLKELQRGVLIPAFDIRRWCPKFFDRDHDGEVRVVDVALATSSAPTFFPSHGWAEGKDVTCYADGGLYANNPSDSAIAFARAKRVPINSTSLLSFGTGMCAPPMPKEMADGKTSLDWGYRQWIVHNPHYLLTALFDGSVSASHYRAKLQLDSRYHRVQPALARHVELDQVERIPDLLADADRFDIDEAVAWIKTHWA